MTLLLSGYANALKEVLGYIQDNFPKETILLNAMKRDADAQYINDEFVLPIWSTRHGGIANLATDNSNVLSASGRALARGTVPVETITGAFDISKLAIDASSSAQGAVESALSSQAESLSTDFARHLNRQAYGDGIGIVSKVRATGGSVGSGTIAVEYPDANLDDGRSIDWYGTINGDISPMKYIQADAIVGVGTGAAALGTVTSVTGTSIVTSGAVVTAANDSIYLQDGSGLGAGSSEFLGVRAALSSTTGTSTYAGVARNVTSWTPQFGSSSEALSLSRLEGSYLKAREFGKASDKYAIFVNVTLYQKYGDLLTAMRRTVNSVNLMGGWDGLEFAAGAGRVGVYLDYDVPDGEVVVLNLDSWKLCQVKDISWMEDPSSGALLRLQNTIKYQAVLVWFANVMCVAPAANGRETRKSN